MIVSKGLFTMGHVTGQDKNLGKDQNTGEGTVDFLARFTSSEQFEKVFKEGMGLVEETANYLDGPGRTESKLLDRTGAIAYATESMRLTTRLMQMASWLLLQRAIVAGELGTDEARKEKHRISLSDIGRGNSIPGDDQLPEGLREMVERSLRLLERIRTLDLMIARQAAGEAANENPVANQLDQLARAFGRR
jgi:regulator of CtrA degradation